MVTVISLAGRKWIIIFSFPSFLNFPAFLTGRKKKTYYLLGVEKRGPNNTVGGNVNCYSCYGEQYERSLKN